MDSYPLGRLCLEKGLLDEKQLEHCLEIQRSSPTWRRLGEVLISEGILTGVALANLLSVQSAMRKSAETSAAPPIRGRPPAQSTAAEAHREVSELVWLLSEARTCGSSVILGAGVPPAFRTFGTTQLLEGPPMTEEQVVKILRDGLPAEIWARADIEGFVDASATLPSGERIRATIYRHANGLGASLRPLGTTPASLTSLGLPAGVRELAKPRSGLVLVTGPSGSGKTTTLAALLDAINASRACHILTIERPIETWIEPKRARITRREVGRDAPTFAAALRAALRSDADVIAVAEMSDPETIATAVSAAETGHLVLGTMHTGNSYTTILRILDAFPPHRADFVRGLLAGCLRGILTQRLFPPKGSGGPALAVELLLGTAGIANLIREDRAHQIPYIIQTGRGDGMVSLDDSLAALQKKGRISSATALEHATDPERLAAALGARREGTRAGR